MLVFQDFAFLVSFSSSYLGRKVAFCAKRTAKIGKEYLRTIGGLEKTQKSCALAKLAGSQALGIRHWRTETNAQCLNAQCLKNTIIAA
jgi:hypothetical protein